MKERICILFLVVVLSVFSNGVDGKGKTRGTLSEIARKLKSLNKPAVKTIRTEDGDIIDCVDIHKQPAFDHPALRNHTIQMKPSFDLSMSTSTLRNSSSKQLVTQTWQNNGDCPDGTVPILRVRREDILRATSLKNFGRKPPMIFQETNNTGKKENRFSPFNNTEDARPASLPNRSKSVLVADGNNYIGARGDINVWAPFIELPDDYSAAQIWLLGGPADNFESVEAGWTVNEKVYGEKSTRFFIHWTKDAYKTTGCYNLLCSGFVQTSKEVAVGLPIEPTSGLGGDQYYIHISISQDPHTGNWWLVFGSESVGYWPGSLFSYLKQGSTMVLWGGEVGSTNVKKPPHTRTSMGSGSFADNLYRFACFIQDIKIIEPFSVLKYPESAAISADEPTCYGAINYRERTEGEPTFYFGGPGRNAQCP